MASGDSWKKGNSDPSMTAKYRLRDFLLDDLMKERGSGRSDSFFDIVKTFQPSTARPLAWRTKCVDEMIDGYISHDPVFVRVFSPGVSWNKYMQVRCGYERAIDYALTYGQWPDEAYRWVKDNVGLKLEKGDEDGG